MRVLFWVVLGGLFLRILNPTFGSPLLYVVGDEASTHLSALYMLENKTFFSIHSQYPPLNGYLQIPFLLIAFAFTFLTYGMTTIADFKLFLLTHEGNYLFVPRIISAILGTVTIIIVYKITLLVFKNNKQAAIWASIFAAFSLILIQLSHFGRPWSAALFFFSLAIYYFLQYLNSLRTRKYLLLVGLMIGITSGFLQLGYIAMGLFVLSQLMKERFILKKVLRNKTFLLSFALALLLTTIFSYLTVFKPELEFFIPSAVDKGRLVSELIQKLILTEPLLLLFSLAYLLNSKRSRPAQTMIIMSVVYFLTISFLSYGAMRYLSPLVIFLSPLAGYQVSRLTKLLRIGVLSLLIISGALWNSRWLAKPTFIQAQDYINTHIAADVPMAATSTRYTGFTPSLGAIAYTRKYTPEYYQTLASILPRERQVDNNRNIIFTEKVAVDLTLPERIKKLKDEYNIKYIVYFYLDPIEDRLELNDYRMMAQFSPGREQELNYNRTNLTDITIPELFTIERAGPFVDIIEVRH